MLTFSGLEPNLKLQYSVAIPEDKIAYIYRTDREVTVVSTYTTEFGRLEWRFTSQDFKKTRQK